MFHAKWARAFAPRLRRERIAKENVQTRLADWQSTPSQRYSGRGCLRDAPANADAPIAQTGFSRLKPGLRGWLRPKLLSEELRHLRRRDAEETFGIT